MMRLRAGKNKHCSMFFFSFPDVHHFLCAPEPALPPPPSPSRYFSFSASNVNDSHNVMLMDIYRSLSYIITDKLWTHTRTHTQMCISWKILHGPAFSLFPMAFVLDVMHLPIYFPSILTIYPGVTFSLNISQLWRLAKYTRAVKCEHRVLVSHRENMDGV